tara:strand:+ start:102 stop:422 length:321 start_codon:yes stop_codon:yes gene_type:complete
MPERILFISSNSVIARRFKHTIEGNTDVLCDTITNPYIVKKMRYYDIDRYKKIIIHKNLSYEFPNEVTVNKMYRICRKRELYLLYKYNPFYKSDLTSFFTGGIIQV